MNADTLYTPGVHSGLVGPAGAVLLLGATRGTADRVWPLVRDCEALNVVLDALAADGLRAMPAFALVQDGRVVVRGDMHAHISEGVHLSGAGVATWEERPVEAAQSVLLGVGKYVADAMENTGCGRLPRRLAVRVGVVLTDELVVATDGASGAADSRPSLADEEPQIGVTQPVTARPGDYTTDRDADECADHDGSTFPRADLARWRAAARSQARWDVLVVDMSVNGTRYGRPYLVMEYCPRANLAVRYRQERLSVAEALRIGVRLAAAVRHLLGDRGPARRSRGPPSQRARSALFSLDVLRRRACNPGPGRVDDGAARLLPGLPTGGLLTSRRLDDASPVPQNPGQSGRSYL